jgi:Na+-driven multidrug efflux pump
LSIRVFFELSNWLRSRLFRRAVRIGLPAIIGSLSRALWGVAMVMAIRVLPSTAYAELAVGRSLMQLCVAFGGVFAGRTQLKFAAEGSGVREAKLVNASIFTGLSFSLLMMLSLLLGAELINGFYPELELASLMRLCAAGVFVRTLLLVPNAAMKSRPILCALSSGLS